MKTLNWGILATGTIARTFAMGLKFSRTGSLAAVASRSKDKAEAFVKDFQPARAHESYDALLADASIDAVYIATPHPQHLEWAIKAARAGKHILVEKPIALNHADATLIVDAANQAGVVLMEAFMYRCHPATAKLVELIRNRAIGDVRVIQATFSYHAGYNPESRIFSNQAAGGGILDVGCYTVSIARLIAGAAVGEDFADPISVAGAAHLAPTGVDEWAAATLKFKNGIVAQLATGISVNQENVVRIFGSEGNILLRHPYLYNRNGPERGVIVVQRSDRKEPETIEVKTESTSYTYEADVIGDAIIALRGSKGKAEPAALIASPAPSVQDTLSNMRVLDQWRQSAGLVYEQEKPAHFRRTNAIGAPLSKSADAPMIYGRLDGIPTPISRLVMGVDNQRTFAHAAAIFDHFFELGGNAFDTAWIYASGMQEALLGDWLQLRGVRGQAVIIAKGCHPPFDKPEHVGRQIQQSLERLKIDCADVYMLHRDNLQVPVGEWVDALSEQHRAGRMRLFGGSNWTTARFEEANQYAAANALQPMRVLSNQFSLARMIDPVWHGCLSAGDDAMRAWFEKTQTPLLSWSSQARGFFLPGKAAPDRRDDEEMVRCWYSNDNFKRLDRAKKLAGELGVEPIHVALAYALHQPFPTCTLIGPRTVLETRSSVNALRLSLTAQQVKWLDLRD